ncbi:hypothetical protein ASD11_02345 [Aeromicrobium sp. Root495]|uniref:MCE family protein n=1 Tax=Aeromicrobium sp. Root495 TaxID=1736550 RepID=UPI0006F46ADA|nr:MCE family protein [Aeromicrobium sp. Root495]KQY58523.1 hypothetical protein ASD11_02345 [Aeromicrobium sp. Root495]
MNPRLPGLKLALFAVASVLVVVTIAATIRPFGSSGATRSYTAELTSASRLQVGDDVRVAGVKVGRVTKVSVTPDARARIGFDVADDLALTTASRLQVRYLNLVGDRYVALVDDGSSDTAQPTGTMLTTARTQPALDLNDLLGGFKPLFAALDPDQVNALALDIVKTLQGDGGTVRRLVARTAALTTGLAERDELIGSVVTNLDTTVGTVADRHRELEGLLAGLRSFVSGLAKDRKAIGASLGHIDELTSLSSDLVAKARPSTRADLAHLKEVAAALGSAEGTAVVDHTLDFLPGKLQTMVRTASYGSWFNYYVCSVGLRIDTAMPIDAVVGDLLERIRLVDTAARCSG